VRPLTEEERRQRRDQVAAVAAGLFLEGGWAGLTLDQVAKKAGMAKGSLFLHFGSKEDLLLHAVGNAFEAWTDRLGRLVPKPAPADLAHAVLGTLRADPALLPLLGLMGPVLEGNCSPEAIVAFKERLADRMGSLAGRWAPWVPQVTPEEWFSLFLEVYALTLGCWAAGEASDRVRGALAGRPDLQPLLTSFEDLFLPLAEARFRGLFRSDSPR